MVNQLHQNFQIQDYQNKDSCQYIAGLLNYFKKGSSYKCQNFARSSHSHEIMQMWHVLDFSNKKT